MFGMVIEVRELQLLKAKDPIVVTESGMVIEVREVQLWKAKIPIDFKVGGSNIEIIFEELQNNDTPL